MIDIENVCFGYREEEENLKDIKLHISPGECVLICGKSGCGKTTVTKLVNGLIPHFVTGAILSGKVNVAGMDTKDTPIYKLGAKIGSVFQNPKSQFFNVDSDSELAFGLENEGASYEFIRRRIIKTTEDLKIEKLRHRNIFAMSGGEKQSLAFAAVYAMNPDIYVLDEPSANLDVDAIEVLKEHIAKIKEQGKTVIIAEHRLYYLSSLVDRVLYMDKGRILREFSNKEFLMLEDEERVKMGLRTVSQEHLKDKHKADYNENDELVIKDLCYKADKNIIFEDISFSANTNDIIGIVGHNGTGKSSMVRCISGLLKESEGKVYFRGKSLNSKKRNKLCYMIMQDVNHQLFSDSLWGECEMSNDDIADTDIGATLKAFDLYDLKENHPMALSGGQKQRLAVATGVLSRKKVIIFDEPTSGLDYAHMIEVSDIIKELSQRGHIILIISHDTEFINLTCTKIFTMK